MRELAKKINELDDNDTENYMKYSERADKIIEKLKEIWKKEDEELKDCPFVH